VKGVDRYLYRALDSAGQTIDCKRPANTVLTLQAV
jgi:transposase-like protein